VPEHLVPMIMHWLRTSCKVQRIAVGGRAPTLSTQVGVFRTTDDETLSRTVNILRTRSYKRGDYGRRCAFSHAAAVTEHGGSVPLRRSG
jgi:hypothetical protein